MEADFFCLVNITVEPVAAGIFVVKMTEAFTASVYLVAVQNCFPTL